MADFGPIGGGLSFGGGGKDYESAYASALAMNQQNYNNILAGYQNTGIANQNAQGKIKVGYQNLQSNVLGSIAGIDRSQRQDIADTYAKNIGIQSQELINRGLGNSTVQSSVGRGLLYDKSKSDIALTNATQGLNAQYMSQLGLAGLGYDERAAQQNAMWQKGQLDFMNSVSAAYPDPRSYMEMAMMKGKSGMGGGVMQSSAPGSSGPVKSPLGAGGGYPSYGAGAGYAGYYGNNRPGGGGGAETIDIPYSDSWATGEVPASGWWDPNTGWGGAGNANDYSYYASLPSQDASWIMDQDAQMGGQSSGLAEADPFAGFW